MIDSFVERNGADAKGGGIINFDDGVITLTNSQIMTNTAILGGGGIWNQGRGEILLDGSLISGNQAFSNIPGFLAGGGGIRNIEAGVVTIQNSAITENQSQYGGGIHTSGSGGIWIQQDQNNRFLPGTTRISSNFATGDGGGVYNEGHLNLAASTLNANTAFGGGGGILIWERGQTSIISSTLSFNAAENGGGIEIGSQGVVTLTNTTLANNSALNLGGGIVVYDSGSVALTHNTLAYNAAHKPNGSAIHNTGSQPVWLAGTLLAENLEGPNCYGNIRSLGDNLSDDGSCHFIASDRQTADARIDTLKDNGDPTQTIALLPATSLLPKSPAIDYYSPPCRVDKDQRGTSRPQGPGCDIGAYELIQAVGTANPGSSVTVSRIPQAAGQSAAWAELENNTVETSPVTVTLAIYAWLFGNRREKRDMWGLVAGFARNQPPHTPPITADPKELKPQAWLRGNVQADPLSTS